MMFVCAVTQNPVTTNLISNDETIGHNMLDDIEFEVIKDAAFLERKLSIIFTCIMLTLMETI